MLLLAAAPGLDAAQADETMRSVVSALHVQDGVEAVLSRAAGGEVRVAVRFAPGTSAAKALTLTTETWNAAPPPGFAAPRLEPIARGARARSAWFVVARAGRPAATATLDRLLPGFAAAPHGIARFHLAGAVRPMLTLELQPPPMRDAGVGLHAVREAIDRLLTTKAAMGGVLNGVASAAALRIVTTNTSAERVTRAYAGKLPPASLGLLVAVLEGSGEPTREARNGHLPVTVLLADAGTATPPAEVTAFEQAVRSHPDVVQAAGAGDQWLPAAVGSAYRFAVAARSGAQPEPLDAWSRRLQAVREVEGLTGMLAMQGADGVPESLDVDAAHGRLWTVWVMASGPGLDVTLRDVQAKLSEGPWQATALSAEWDTGLGWVLGAVGTLGLVVAAPDGTQLAAAVQSAGSTLKRVAAVASVEAGPARLASPARLTRLERKATAESAVAAADFSDALDLLEGPQRVGTFAGVPVWLALPHGERAVGRAALPLGWRDVENEDSAELKAWTLGDFERLPDPTPTLDRVRLDAHPALWLVAAGRGESPDAFAASAWQAVERAVALQGGMVVHPLVLGLRTLGKAP
ncbi:MAG: hypothetical protein EXR79_09315 [Myxococcales bacterium]|nr:hypothetical protein [Myxococcales bacterium]